jgi:DNA-binding HxlR family transcriptional regulator
LVDNKRSTAHCADLQDALPGIATNLLAERLRQLEAEGIIERYEAPSPVRATVYRLTTRGRELGPVLQALVIWGTPLLGRGQRTDAFRTHWLIMALRISFNGVDVSDLAPLNIVLETGDEPAIMDVRADGLTVQAGTGTSPTDAAAVVVEGRAAAVVALLTGPTGARTPGISIRGSRDAIRRLHALIARSRFTAARTTGA